MAKSILKIDDDEYDFILIGISSGFRDFRVCREVNTSLGLDLCRMEDYTVFDRKRDSDLAFPFFEFVNEHEDRFYIIGNKSDGALLIPEQRQLDFFLLVKPGMSPFDRSEIVKTLNKVPQFQGAFPIDVMSLKSKENLLF